MHPNPFCFIYLEYTDASIQQQAASSMMSKGQKNRSCRGVRAFTLVELLVTIGILAILAAFVLPAIKSIREMSRGVLCTVHIRNASQAISLYVSDFRGYVPFAGREPQVLRNPAGESVLVGGYNGLYLGHWSDLMPEYWSGDIWPESLMCPDQPSYDPDAADWPHASVSVDGFRRQSWYDLSAAFHLTPRSLSRGSRLHDAVTAAQPLSQVAFPSSKALLYENLGFCIPKDSEAYFWIDAAQTQRYATSVATVDGAVFRYARRNANEPAFGVGIEYTMHGVLGRDIDHSWIGADAHHRFGQPNSWADTD